MSAEEFEGRQLAIGSVHGVRSFEVDQLGRLTGIYYKDIWRPGENIAECGLEVPDDGWVLDTARSMSAFGGQRWYSNGEKYTTDPPMRKARPDGHSMAKCSHGYYAYYDGSNDYQSDARISAVVEGYGETLIGTRGFRASKARIVAICIPGAKVDNPAEAPLATKKQRWLPGWPMAARVVYCLANGANAGGAVASFTADDPGRGAFLTFAFAANLALSFVFPVYPSKRKTRKIKREERKLMSDAVRWPTIDGPKLKAYRKMHGIPDDGAGEDIASAIDAETVRKIRRNYPDIPVYNKFTEMIVRHPTDIGAEPSPENDPNFWSKK